MNLTDLTKSKLVVLALQFQVFNSVKEASLASTEELIAALEKSDDCVDLVHSVVR